MPPISIGSEALKTASRIGGAIALAFLAPIEAPMAAGVVDRGVIIRVFAGADGATWTIVASNAEGKSRLLSANTDWQ